MITIILASLFFSFYFIHIAKIPSAIKTGFKLKAHQRIKPIDCFSCLPVWVAMILYCLPEIVSIICIILFGAGCIANAILYILNKLP
jgi:hypothetical protein